MKRATENQRNVNTRTLSEYFPQRNKVKDIIFQQRFRPHFTPETPMKPSQLPNQLSYPPPRRMLPLQSPELCHRGRLGPQRHPPHPPGPIHSSRFAPINPTNIGPPVNRFDLMPRGRLGPLQHQHHERPGSFYFSTASRPQPLPPSVFHPASPQFMKDLSNHSSPSHIRRDPGTESMVTLPHSGNKNLTAQRQMSNKDQSSDVRNNAPTIKLHSSFMTPSLLTRAVQDVLPPSKDQSPGYSQRPPCDSQPSPNNQPFDRSNGSSLPIMDSPVAPCQEQQHKRMPSSENSIPVVDLNCSSQKRHREFENCDVSSKKPRLSSINSDKAQTAKPAVGNSHSISLLPQPSARHSSVLELSPKTTDSHLGTEPACGQSTHLELSSTFKPTQSSCASLSLKPCIKKWPSLGAKQAYIYSTQNHPLKLLQLRSPSVNPGEESLTKISEESDNRDKSSSVVTQKDTGSSPHDQLDSHHSGHTHRSTLPVKTQSRSNHVEESRKSDSGTHKPVSKTNSGSLNCCAIERNKSRRSRRPVAVPNDINELFTPDPLVYVVSHKSVKPNMNGIKCPTSEKSCSSSTGTTSSTPITGSSCRKTGSHAVDTKVSSLSSAHHLQMSSPTVTLQRVKLDNLKSTIAEDNELKNSPVPSSGKHLNDESVKSDEKCTSVLPNNVKHCTVETGTTTSHCSQSPLLERNIDVELDLGLSIALDLDVTQSSLSSEEEEQLVSLQEMMAHVTKPPDTPEKGAFSEPSTPGRHSSQPKSQPLPSTTKPGIYKNNLDQMLKEINNNKKAKEIETQLLTACKEDLLRIAEFEEDEMKREEGVSAEQQEFLQRYSLMSNAIKEVPPGEAVFNLEKFGRIFNQDTLQLRRCMVNPQGTAQKALLWSSPSQLRLHVNIGLFQEAYDFRSPCPTQVTRFLFRMMSVHSERMLSEKILQALCDIACSTAYQIVKTGSQQLKVWVPSLADVALVLMNMGVAFVTLFPFENLQPPFTEGDLLEDICIKSESPSSNTVQDTFPEHNCNNILKYLSYCMGLCPRAYSDDELLLLLTVVGKVGLDTRLILQSSVELYPLQYTLVNNIRDWNTMLPRICQALSDLTDDHHNMCQLVQVLPDNTRGKQLRRHLSLSMISKLLDGNCTYRPTENEFQLSDLRRYLPRMQPSSIFRGMLSRKDKEVDRDALDQQSYYLCYSLLTLANEASNFQFFPAHQKRQLLFLCSELETHVKCDIRESEKCLYRSKVKDLVARIYTKWQMLLQRTRPLHGKLYDYWQPLPADTLTCSQEVKNGNVPVTVEDEEEDSDEDVLTIVEDKEMKEGDNAMEDTNKMEEDMKPEEMEVHSAMDDTGN